MSGNRLGTIVLWAILLSAMPTYAQQDQGMVAGRVVDPSGTVVRLSNGVQGSLSYTWSHSIDDVIEPFGAGRLRHASTRGAP